MYVGVDVHKRVCRAAIVNAEGTVVDEVSFRNSKTGIDELVTRLDAATDRVVVAVESTATLWIQIYDRLEERGIRVVLSNPYKTRLIAEARIKTDTVDARTLAQRLRADMLPLCYVPTKTQREARQFIRHRITLGGMRTAVKNRIHTLLDKHGLRCPYKTLFSKRGVEWLRSVELGVTDDTVLQSDLAVLAVLDEQIASMDAKIATVAVTDERVLLLMTMPGLGYFAAYLLVVEVCNINRFRSDRRLVRWAGLAPGVHQSGDKTYGGRITKQGNKLVRWVLVEAARNACRYDARFRAFYARYSRRHGGQKAVVAVAHEMLRIVWFMLSRGEPYRGGRTGLSERTRKRWERIADRGLRA